MKNTKKYLQMALVVLVLALAPLMTLGDEAGQPVANKTAKYAVSENLFVKQVLPKTEIVAGESEAQKRSRGTVGSSVSRELASREATPERDYNLGELRALYREAAARYGIDWRLIEAVHQVETGKSITCKRSYAGATGPMQFMPSTFRHYSDGGDICNLRDSIFAAANLLAASGADVGDIDGALFNYNHSMSYVAKVKDVMNSI